MNTTARRYFLPSLLRAHCSSSRSAAGPTTTCAGARRSSVVWWVLVLGARVRAASARRALARGAVAVAALVALAGLDGARRALERERRAHAARGVADARVRRRAPARRAARSAASGGGARRPRSPLTAVVVCGLAFASRLAARSLDGALEETDYVTKRLSYPFNYWNARRHLGGDDGRAGARLERPRRRAGGCAPPRSRASRVAVSVAYLTYSRSAAVGVAVAAVAVIVLSRHRWLAALHALLAAAGIRGRDPHDPRAARDRPGLRARRSRLRSCSRSAPPSSRARSGLMRAPPLGSSASDSPPRTRAAWRGSAGVVAVVAAIVVRARRSPHARGTASRSGRTPPRRPTPLAGSRA